MRANMPLHEGRCHSAMRLDGRERGDCLRDTVEPFEGTSELWTGRLTRNNALGVKMKRKHEATAHHEAPTGRTFSPCSFLGTTRRYNPDCKSKGAESVAVGGQ